MKEATSLKSLAEQKTDGVNKTTTFRVDPDLVTFEKGFNLRGKGEETDAHIERLYLAMKEGADIPPIDVYVKDGVVIARTGHCRTKAAQRLKKEMPDYTLECRQFRGNDKDAIVHMLGSDTGAKPLTPLEQGIGFLRLIRMGMQNAEIAQKLGISVVTVSNNLTLAEAPAEVQDMVRKGEVSATTAREVVKKGKEAVDALKEKVVEARAATPAPKKKGAKKGTGKKKHNVVTAKKLKGTKAAKKTKKKKAKAPAQPEVASDEILIRVKKHVAAACAPVLRASAGEEEKELANALEMALL